MGNFVLRLVINALALSAAAWLVPGVRITDEFVPLLLVAGVFGLVNAILGPILKLLALPFIFFTLGLFLLVVNAVLLLITDRLMEGLVVDSFQAAVLGALVVSITGMVLNAILVDDKKKKGK